MSEIQTLFSYLTPISLTIGVINHKMTLNNTRKNQKMQLETKQAQLLMQIYNNWWIAEQLRLFAKSMQMEWDDYEDFQSKYSVENFEEGLPFTTMSYFFDGVGVLVNEGLVDIVLVSKLIAGDLKTHWERFEPKIREHRKRRSFPQYFDDVELLYD